MENKTENKIPILRIAWSRYAQLDQTAKKNAKSHYGLRRWVAILSVLAVLFAGLTETYPENLPGTGKVALKVFLVIFPILASVLAVFSNKFYGGGGWLIMQAGAEEIQKEIYIFRTILKDESKRREWLEKRLADIQRQVYRGLGGEMVLNDYEGQLPPHHNPENPESDSGFNNLTGDEYFAYRLSNKLAWHVQQVNKTQKKRTILQWFILIAGLTGSFLAAMGGDLSIWVAVTVAIASAFIGWLDLRNLDDTLKSYSKVIVELMAVYDHWLNLEAEERTKFETFKMVKATENILRNIEYIRSEQKALDDAELKETDLIDHVLQKSIEDKLAETFEEALNSIVEEASSELVQQELSAMTEATEQVVETILNRFSKMRLTMDEIAKDYEGIEFNADTPASELHAMMQRFPKTGEVKG